MSLNQNYQNYIVIIVGCIRITKDLFRYYKTWKSNYLGYITGIRFVHEMTVTAVPVAVIYIPYVNMEYNNMNIIILFTILVVKSSDQLNHRNGPTTSNDIVKCMSALIESNFDDPGLIIFGNSPNTSSLVMKIREDVLKYIHKRNKFTVQIANPHHKTISCALKRDKASVFHFDLDNFHYKYIPIAKYFIIIVNSLDDFSYITSQIIRSQYWNPYAHFIVLLCEINKSDAEKRRILEDIFSCLFHYNAINVIICISKGDTMRSLNIFGWRPYDPPKYCGHHNETIENQLIVENICERGLMKYKKRVFADRLPNNMHGCAINILALERQPYVSRTRSDPNIEKLMVNELLRKHNFSIKYEIIKQFRGERNEKGKWNGALKELIARRGHILLGGIFPDFDVHEDFECSLTYLADSYAWVVPRAYFSQPWISLTVAFNKCVWYVFVVGFIVCVFAWKFLGETSDDTNYNKTFIHCFLNTWITSLGFAAYMRPVKESLRVFYIFFNLYCILFITAYQTKLIEVLWNPTYEHQINTVEELVRSQIKFGGFEELHDLFYNSSDPFDYIIGEKWIVVNNISEALRDVVVYRNFSVLCSRLELAHLSAIMPELTDNHGRNTYFAFQMNTFTVPMEMIALKGFPFMKNISRTLGIYKQLGLNDMVRSYFRTLNMKRRAKLVSFHGQHHNLNALTVQHLQGGFFALALGMVSGTAILILEILLQNRYIGVRIQHFRTKLRFGHRDYETSI